MEWTLEDIAVKMDSEGGLDGFLRWRRLSEDEIPHGIYFEYREAEQAWRAFREAEDALMAKLPSL